MADQIDRYDSAGARQEEPHGWFIRGPSMLVAMIIFLVGTLSKMYATQVRSPITGVSASDLDQVIDTWKNGFYKEATPLHSARQEGTRKEVKLFRWSYDCLHITILLTILRFPSKRVRRVGTASQSSTPPVDMGRCRVDDITYLTAAEVGFSSGGSSVWAALANPNVSRYPTEI